MKNLINCDVNYLYISYVTVPIFTPVICLFFLNSKIKNNLMNFVTKMYQVFNKIVKDNDPALLNSSSSTSKHVFVHCFNET